MGFSNAKWIWVTNKNSPDSYGEFVSRFKSQKLNAKILISCDSDYCLFVNGKFVSSNQYGDFEWYKSYDEIDITQYLIDGENLVAILVWHFGVNSQRYLKSSAGLIFEVFEDGKSILSSGVDTLSRYSLCYENGKKKIITPQLGFSFCYDLNKEDGWQTSPKNFSKSVLIDKQCSFVPRPTKKLQLLDKINGKITKIQPNHYLVDLSEEYVGLPCLKFSSKKVQKVTVAWGESLTDGQVRRIIGIRDFSFDLIAKKGENEYVNYMLRLGCRYLEIWSEEEIVLDYLAIIPQIYPTEVIPFTLDNPLDQKIYDACINTLKNCMMEHYVDTPWREQCLYAYDSRNQILCGFLAFKGGNKEYARANLKLIGVDKREDDLLSICSPCGADLTIPSFSLYYILALKEYFDYTGDKGLIIDLYPRLLKTLQVFVNRIKDGLACKFDKVCHWNFYDWTDYLSGQTYAVDEPIPDAMINLLLIIALKSFKVLSISIGKAFDLEETLNTLITNTKNHFYRKDKKLFELTKGGGEFTVLVNAISIIAGITTKEEGVAICEAIENDQLLDCTLSMKIFKYQAMLCVDKNRWSDWVLNEIRREYGKMIESGSSCVWETAKGYEDFSLAGSLCHGWSAVPIYFYHQLKNSNG